MGRGEHPRQNHHKKVSLNDNKLTYWKIEVRRESIEPPGINRMIVKKIKAYEQLVLLGFAITSFTPVAYQRSSLLRLLKVNSSCGRFHA